ncbi:hypothetical protein B0H10DRAFT_1969480 [Mycena sp. CBHHK59/15]|nr:hypothetical protein B0H10DRAFT_1969480 [Mycena sp. CBHHK59/15]
MPHKARAIISRTKNLFKSTKKGRETAESSDSETEAVATSTTSDVAGDMNFPATDASPVNEIPRIEEIPDEGDPPYTNEKEPEPCRESSRTSSETPFNKFAHPSDIDPNLIEIIGRFEIMDEYDPADCSDLPGDPGDDSDEDDGADDTEIQEISQLELFVETLKRAQEIAVTRDGKDHTSIPGTQREPRRGRGRSDMKVKGFLSVAAFFGHIKNKISNRGSPSAPSPSELEVSNSGLKGPLAAQETSDADGDVGGRSEDPDGGRESRGSTRSDESQSADESEADEPEVDAAACRN